MHRVRRNFLGWRRSQGRLAGTLNAPVSDCPFATRCLDRYNQRRFLVVVEAQQRARLQRRQGRARPQHGSDPHVELVALHALQLVPQRDRHRPRRLLAVVVDANHYLLRPLRRPLAQLDKTFLRSSADGVVTEIVAEVGEAIGAGQPVIAIEKSDEQWLSFVREDFLNGLTVGSRVSVQRQGASEMIPGIVTELLPQGPFATWQAEHAIGAHDLNTLRVRIDLLDNGTKFEPGMTVGLNR